MANIDVFEVWFPKMGKHEGNFVDHPNDPGGATNKGVTLDTFRTLAPKLFGIPGTLDNLKKLTAAQQKAIAKAFWDNLGDSGISTYRIRNWGIQYQAIEQYWGSGGRNMHPLQRAVNRLKPGRLTVDGAFGNQTLTALNEIVDQTALFHAVYEERLNFYDAIIARNPKLNSFRNGWAKRLIEGYLDSCKVMGYKPIEKLHDRLIKWSPNGPAVMPFDKAVPNMRKLNGQPFFDTGFTGTSSTKNMAVQDQGTAKTDDFTVTTPEDEKKNFA